MLVLLLIGIVACNPIIETTNQNETQGELSENSTDISQRQIQGRNWINQFDKPVNFECPKNHYMSWIKSSHKNWYEDRQWDFGCKEQPFNYDTQKCKWTGWLNDWDKELLYTCNTVDGADYIAGMYSEHDNWTEDRRFKVKCCSGEGTCLTNCKFTDWINDYDGWMYWSCDAGYVMQGLKSVHSNWYEDRRWKIQTCKLTEC